MRTRNLLACLLILPAPLFGSGCTTTRSGAGPGLALGPPKVLPGVRTTTTIGDRPVSVIAGLPGESAAAETALAEPEDRADGRISGRVLDDLGDPVSGARVRLADGSAPFGRVVSAVTDASGGFTLRGLRPGDRYQLIAESESPARGGRTVRLGRGVARAPETDVRLRVDTADAPVESPPRPRRQVDAPDVDPEFDDSSFEPLAERRPAARGSRVNPDDLPPVEEAERLAARPSARPAQSLQRAAWRSASDEGLTPIESVRDDDPPRADPPPGRTTQPEIDPAREPEPEPAPARRSVFGLPVEDDGGANPLPPAIERAKVPDPAPADSGEPLTASPTDEGTVFAPASAPASVPTSQPIATEPPTPDLGFGDGPAPPEAPGASPADLLPAPESAPSTTDPTPDSSPFADAPATPAAPVDDPSPLASEGFGSAPSLEVEPAPAFESAPALDVEPETPAAVEPPEVEPPAEAVAAPAEPQAETTDDTPFVAGPDPLPEPGPTEAAEPLGSFGEPSAVQGSAAGGAPGIQVERSDQPRPTWSELTAQSAERRALQYPTSTRRLPKAPTEVAETPAPAEPEHHGPLGLGRLVRGGGQPDPSTAVATCSFDERRNRLVDFALPDVQGRPVRFQDLDADFILIDFWGTWCGPCLNTIPHLVEVQNRFDPRRVRVVGVAYEQGTPEENASAVVDTMRRLGVNYPVLMGERDGKPCPLAAAFRVQAYPTLVLVDRHGRVLWRDTGGGPATLTRLDRVLAANTRAGVVRR